MPNITKTNKTVSDNITDNTTVHAVPPVVALPVHHTQFPLSYNDIELEIAGVVDKTEITMMQVIGAVEQTGI